MGGRQTVQTTQTCLKVPIIGLGSGYTSGKLNFLRRSTGQDFIPYYTGIRPNLFSLEKKYTYKGTNKHFKLSLWRVLELNLVIDAVETSEIYLRNSCGILLLLDINELENVFKNERIKFDSEYNTNTISRIKQFCPNVPIYLILTQIDKNPTLKEIEITKSYIQKFTNFLKEQNLNYNDTYFISSKSSSNEDFKKLWEELLPKFIDFSISKEINYSLEAEQKELKEINKKINNYNDCYNDCYKSTQKGLGSSHSK